MLPLEFYLLKVVFFSNWRILKFYEFF